MSLPANARVRAARGLARNLVEAYSFLMDQDRHTARSWFQRLQVRLQDARTRLAWNPACGRPARFLAGHSAQGQLQATRVVRLANQAGLAQLRELVVGRYVLLYAHSATEVMLLALKHERQLAYSLGPDTE